MQSIIVENLSCGGCVATITSKLETLEGVDKVQVNLETGRIDLRCDEQQLEAVRKSLHALGYPEPGAASGLGAVGTKARSYVSCAIGKVGAA